MKIEGLIDVDDEIVINFSSPHSKCYFIAKKITEQIQEFKGIKIILVVTEIK